MFDADWKSVGLDSPNRHGVHAISLDGRLLRVHLSVYAPGEGGCCATGDALVWLSAHDHKITVERIRRLPDVKN